MEVEKKDHPSMPAHPPSMIDHHPTLNEVYEVGRKEKTTNPPPQKWWRGPIVNTNTSTTSVFITYPRFPWYPTGMCLKENR